MSLITVEPNRKVCKVQVGHLVLISFNFWIYFLKLFWKKREKDFVTNKAKGKITQFTWGKKSFLNSVSLPVLGKYLKGRCHLPFLRNMALNIVAKQNQNFSDVPLLWWDWGRVIVAPTELLLDLSFLSYT